MVEMLFSKSGHTLFLTSAGNVFVEGKNVEGQCGIINMMMKK